MTKWEVPGNVWSSQVFSLDCFLLLPHFTCRTVCREWNQWGELQGDPVSRPVQGLHVFYLQGPLHQQLHRNTRVPHRSWDSSGTAHGCKLFGLLKLQKRCENIKTVLKFFLFFWVFNCFTLYFTWYFFCSFCHGFPCITKNVILTWKPGKEGIAPFLRRNVLTSILNKDLFGEHFSCIICFSALTPKILVSYTVLYIWNICPLKNLNFSQEQNIHHKGTQWSAVSMQ